ncbi:ABSCISIC ACID-INSENSITIVE 5-like protein 5 isoform X2 [Cynara cardunculus var. scolymus]|uniref:ABSCISIC ACID-INSENSITIVE 5-like protein 5 isoform X2 n=1 Tax=Cynara cardunculus var. scolymus TaxID=59895 RepID=UPI000D62BD06|nr:ABSCISIC ACID-INSENSITIVE 5-like protein 5 isoform X2 [Cynara cardunculus var. scolymus]
MNLKNFGNQAMEMDSTSGRPPGNFPLARQGSIYSLTFDELQNTMGSIGKDFGSMNMDELLKNIWNAEEMQTMGFNTSTSVQDRGGVGGTNLQRQGSLTLPRTLSQKTVDQVWKDLSKENSNSFGQPNLPQRQQTLGEMTLEEFLVKAGVVREETHLAGKPNDNGLFSNLTNNPGFGAIGFQPAVGQNASVDVMRSRIPDPDGGSNQISFQSANLPLNGNGVRSAQNQQQPLFPKQTNLPYGAPMGLMNSNHLGSPVIRNGVVGLSDPLMNGNLVSAATLQGGIGGMVGLGGGGGGGGEVTVAAGSPPVSSDGIGKSNGDTSSVSPAPCVFNGVMRGRKGSAIEKVVERRQRRMIKNRESAARSRARKQAYTMELEAEVSELKQKNQELKRKQADMMEMQKNQVMEMMNMQPGTKRQRLRKTVSGPW